MADVQEEKRQKFEDCDSKVEQKDGPSSFEEEKVVNEDEYTLVVRREMTADEYSKYKKQVKASKGFDVERFPAMLPGGIVPRDVNGHDRDLMMDLSKQALDYYNSKNNAGFEIIDLVKATYQCVQGSMFYITFRAKDATALSNSTCQTFRAKVWKKLFNEGSEVQLCQMI